MTMPTPAQPSDDAPSGKPETQTNWRQSGFSPKERKILLIACLPIFSIALSLIYRLRTRFIDNVDPFIYSHVAQEILSGKRLYSQTWQDKPPLGFLLYAVPQLFSPHSYPALGSFLGLWLAAEGLLFFIAFRRELPVALTCLAFTTLFPLTYWDYGWASLEHFANPFVAGLLLLAYFIFQQRRFTTWQCALAGLLAVIAFHIRQNTAPAAVVPVGAILCMHQPLRRMVIGLTIMALAALASWGSILLLVMRIGNLHGYFYTTFEYPLGYADVGQTSEVLSSLWTAVSTPWSMLLFLTLGLALLGRYRWFVLSSLAAGIVLCIAPKRMYPHYWVGIFPFIALYLGIVLQQTSVGSTRIQWAVFAAVTLMGGVHLAASLGGGHYEFAVNYSKYQKIAATAEAAAADGSTLLVIGPIPSEAIVFISSLPTANQYCFSFQFEPPYPDLLPESHDAIFSDYMAHPPGVIVFDRGTIEDVAAPGFASFNSYRLLKMLTDANKYEIKNNVGEFMIAVRQTSPAR